MREGKIRVYFALRERRPTAGSNRYPEQGGQEESGATRFFVSSREKEGTRETRLVSSRESRQTCLHRGLHRDSSSSTFSGIPSRRSSPQEVVHLVSSSIRHPLAALLLHKLLPPLCTLGASSSSREDSLLNRESDCQVNPIARCQSEKTREEEEEERERERGGGRERERDGTEEEEREKERERSCPLTVRSVALHFPPTQVVSMLSGNGV